MCPEALSASAECGVRAHLLHQQSRAAPPHPPRHAAPRRASPRRALSLLCDVFCSALISYEKEETTQAPLNLDCFSGRDYEARN